MLHEIMNAAAEVIAAHHEHNAMMLVGGHEPKRLNEAIAALEAAIVKDRSAQTETEN